MKPYTRVDVSEAQLEDLVRRYSDSIEDGLVFLDHQKQAAAGRLDILLTDSGKSLAVAELKVVEDDGMLMQGVDYYDDVTAHVETYSRLYGQEKVDPTQPVRLLLIAPSFSQKMVNRCKWLDLPISLFTFQCLRFDGEADVVPVFADYRLPVPPVKPEIATLQGHLDYITDPEVRTSASAFIDEVKTWKPGSVAIDPIKYSLSMKINGRVFVYLSTYRKHYRIATYDHEENWIDAIIKDDNDREAMESLARAAMERKATQ